MKHVCLLYPLALAGAIGVSPTEGAVVYIEVKTSAQTGQLKVWGSDDGQQYTYRVSSSAYMAALRRGHKPFDRYLLKLDGLPRHVRLGTQGQFLGRVGVDVVRAIVDGKPRTPLGVEPLGEVHDAKAALARDGRVATIVQRGQKQANALVLTFDPVPVVRPKPIGPCLYGLYTGPLPTPERVKAVAWYDFSVLQQGKRIPEFVRQVKAVNPQHRVILRLLDPNHSCLEYAYHADSRDFVRHAMIDRVCAGITELIWGVTLNEEQPGNHFRGTLATHLPPRWIYEYRYHYERETGKRFAWPSRDVNAWLGDKYKSMLNDLYDYIKKRYPTFVVYQWVELAGYGNISGWYPYVKPPLKMDGYMLEWFENTWEVLAETPIGPGARRVEFFSNYFGHLTARDRLPSNRIVCQVWGHEPGRHPLPQIDRVKQTGANWIYFFWPWAGMPDVPGTLTVGNRPPGPSAKYAMQVWPEVKRYIERDRAARR